VRACSDAASSSARSSGLTLTLKIDGEEVRLLMV